MRTRNLIFSALLILFSVGATAGEISSMPARQKSTLKFTISVEPKFQKVLEGILNPAFQLVMAVGSEHTTIAAGNDQNSDFVVLFTDREAVQELTKMVPEVYRFVRGLHGDAFSFMLPEDPLERVYVIVLVDDAMYENQHGHRVERPGAFSRLVTLLGHEIYGNVASFKKHSAAVRSSQFQYSERFRANESLKSEVRAFTASVKFLETLLAKFEKMLPATTVNSFREALVRERDLLKMYQVRAEVDLGFGTVTALPSRCEVVFK